MAGSPNQRSLARWLPALGWACTIVAVSHSSDPPQAPGLLPMADKFAHMGIYFVLSLLTYWAARARLDPWPAAVLAFGCALAFGATDEWHQSFVPNRVPDLMDWIADAVGAAGVFAVARHAAEQEPDATQTADAAS